MTHSKEILKVKKFLGNISLIIFPNLEMMKMKLTSWLSFSPVIILTNWKNIEIHEEENLFLHFILLLLKLVWAIKQVRRRMGDWQRNLYQMVYHPCMEEQG